MLLFQMHASGGNGGCCDCGDIEAWKRDPACEKHAQSSDEDCEKVNNRYESMHYNSRKFI